MICPYCLDDVSEKSLEHKDCKIAKGKEFPAAYVRFHGSEVAADPVVFSVVGFGRTWQDSFPVRSL